MTPRLVNPSAQVPVRLVAYVVDCSILFGGVLLSQGAIAALGLNPILGIINSGQQLSGDQFHLWVFSAVSLPIWFYFALFESSSWQATPGKRLLRLKVTDLDGGRIGLGRALLRAIVLLIPFEVNHVVLFRADFTGSAPSGLTLGGFALVWLLLAVYLATALLNRRGQSIHDLVARTQVGSSSHASARQ
ncbi:MAG: RDD family protein [Chloroflexales bacterium]|nr:RDD family protein [Chloroflexales bacterium]